MVTDQQLHRADSERPEVWAPMHAWRALGQLRADAAIEPLISLLRDSAEDDWARDELPLVFGMIGRAAIPALSQYLADPAHELWTRISAVDALQNIAESDPSAHDEVVAILMRELEKWWRHDETLNGFLISSLVDLRVVEAVPLMEQAFAADRVDTLMRGDWEDVQVDLGLLTERQTPRPQLQLRPFRRFDEEPVKQVVHSRQAEKAKAKRKLARQSRKRNRRRK
ncbi:MAG: DUF1186 domain-containing protein [Gemmatimonadota bacterium]|nr:DUF1186 domain-containing protein [Gemmatimonadota bacterium]